MSPLAPLALTGVEVLALPVLPAEADGDAVTLGPGAADVIEALALDAFAILETVGATGAAGEVFTHVVTDRSGIDNDELRVVAFVGVGEARPQDLRRAGAALARALVGRHSVVTTVPAVGGPDVLEAFVVGAMLGSFGFHWKSVPPEQAPVARIVLAETPASQQDALERAVAIGGASWRSRVLATVPANLKDPEWLAEQARVVAAESGLTCTVWDEHELAKRGFGGLVAVGRASATPPRLIRLDYTPAGSPKAPHVVLIGKGITFDSGGLSIKPGESMVTMKRDMTGGGVVISVLAALAAAGCQVRVTGLVAAAENAVGGAAFRPGDVIRHYGGRTTEVTNTDAEGRLVLADALAYAAAELAPDVLVDIATLTGAMKVAMGQRTGGYFANHDGLAAAISDSGTASGEPVWRFPLASEYEDKLTSKIADADNGAGNPGAITAALFLQHFTGDVPWVHLDIASVGDSPTDTFEWSKGPTGFGARLLLHWLGGAAPLEGIA